MAFSDPYSAQLKNNAFSLSRRNDQVALSENWLARNRKKSFKIPWFTCEKGRQTVNASSAHIESESSAHIANESPAHRETASSAHKERSSAHIDAGNQPFRVWLGGVGGS